MNASRFSSCDLWSSTAKGRRISSAAILAVAGFASTAIAVGPPVFEAVAVGRAAQPDGGGSITLPVPASTSGAAVGDLLVAVVGVKINPSTQTPAGWTAVPGFAGFNGAICASDPTEGIRCQLSVFWKFSDGTETSVNVSFLNPGSPRQAAGAVLRYSNTHTTAPIGPTNSSPGTGTTATAPAIVTTVADNRVLRIALSDVDTGDFTLDPRLLGGPATGRFNLSSKPTPPPPLDSNSVTIAGSDAVQAAAGNSGTATWTQATSEQWRAATIAILPAPLVVDADLSVTKSDGLTKVNPGGSLSYTITVANDIAGNDVTDALVDDLFPSELTCSWTCSSSGGASCTAGPVPGDIAEMVDLPAGSSVTYTAVCSVDGGAAGTITNTATVTAPPGVNDTMIGNNHATDTTLVNVAPVAKCQDIVLFADGLCMANGSIDDGSFDPDADTVTITEAPDGPYGLGDTVVTLTIEDALGLSDMCTATVTVIDDTDPVIACNAPATIVPPDAPISFTATATDNCSVASVEVVAFTCVEVKKNGKVIDKTQSCVVSIDGDTVTILDSGGVGDLIGWSVLATDGSGNTSTETCGVEVVNPGKKKP